MRSRSWSPRSLKSWLLFPVLLSPATSILQMSGTPHLCFHPASTTAPAWTQTYRRFSMEQILPLLLSWIPMRPTISPSQPFKYGHSQHVLICLNVEADSFGFSDSEETLVTSQFNALYFTLALSCRWQDLVYCYHFFFFFVSLLVYLFLFVCFCVAEMFIKSSGNFLFCFDGFRSSGRPNLDSFSE